MTQTEIQLQVFVIEGEVETSKCQEIKKKIDEMLNVLSRTFPADLKFQLAFKCKATGFCDDKESSVIKESDFIASSFQCVLCPEEKMHFINTQAITKYWKQVPADEFQISKHENGCKDLISEGNCGSTA
ncbi:uncharacterized protein LOC134232227 [Saccostrea cucullata]|uniref:uncharacterized protein LOC134232227 n=1 Tax=Saccostrea cuccullata TaxID=36930 RepID=UPI002ED3B7E9